MYRRHQSLYNADFVVQYFHHRRETVGGARRIGYHSMAALESLVIDAIDDRSIDVFAAGRGDDYFFRAASQMRARFFLARKKSGALEHDINAHGAPWQIGRIALSEHADLVAIDDHRVAFHRDRAVKFAMSCVI